MIIQEEIRAIRTWIAKAESDNHIWCVSEDDDRNHEAYGRIAALESQLEERIELTFTTPTSPKHS